jgi:hypothetical protein
MIIVHVRTAWCSSLNLEIQELRRRREIYREAQFEASTTRLMDDACNERLITRTGLATLRRLTTIHTVYCLKLATAYETSRYLHTQRHARSTIFTVDHSLPILHQNAFHPCRPQRRSPHRTRLSDRDQNPRQKQLRVFHKYLRSR